MKLAALSLLLSVFGVALFLYTLTLDRYTDEAAYRAAYQAIHPHDVGLEAAGESFSELRRRYLTPKFELEDYALTAAVTGLVMAVLSLIGWSRLAAPSSRWIVASLGFAASGMSVAALFFDALLLEFREDVPWWSDSLGPVFFLLVGTTVVLVAWVTINLLGLRGRFVAGAKFAPVELRGINWWYAILTLASVGLTLFTVSQADFTMVIPAVLWTYFYASLLAGRHAANFRPSGG